MSLLNKTLPLALLLACLPAIALGQNEGQSKLDEATDKRIEAQSPRDLGKVIELCEQAMEAGLDEDNTDIAKRLLAGCAMQRAQMLAQAIRQQSNANAVRRLRGNIVDDLKKVIKNDPDTADAYVLLAQMEALPGGDRASIPDLVEKAIARLAGQPNKLSEAYVLSAMTKDNNDARLEELQKAVESNPDNAAAWRAKMMLQNQMEAFDKTLEDAEFLLEQNDDNIEAFGAAVDSLVRLKRTDDAIAKLTQRIEENPEEGMYHRVRARVYLGVQEDEKALGDLDKAIELNSRDVQSLILRGQIHYDLNDVDQANRDVSDALLLQPDSVQGILYRSLIAARQERYSAAISDMETLVRFQPSNSSWVIQLASYYQMDDRPRKAIRLLDELVRRNPDEYRALRLSGDAKLAIGDHKEAVDDFENAIRILERQLESMEEDDDTREFVENDYSGALNNLAWVLATSPNDELRNGERSVELGLRACEVTDYEAPHILSTLAAGYAEVGDFKNARRWSKMAVEVGEETENEQLDQLRLELEAYEEERPWREEQETPENNSPVASSTDVIDT
ncbi:MAG: tetratricopeptide repeat protein [Aureliella sp.]